MEEEEAKRQLDKSTKGVQTEAGMDKGGKMTEKERKRRRLVSKLMRQLLLNLAYFILVRHK